MDDKSPQVISFQNPFIVLVVNSKGYMRQVYTPFRVQCIKPAGQIPVNAWVYVDGVVQHKTDRLLYMVGGKLYPYWCFRLQILF